MEEQRGRGPLVVDKELKWLGWEQYNMYLTDKRVVFGRIGSGPAPFYCHGKAARIAKAFFHLPIGSVVGVIRLPIQHVDIHKYDHMDFEQILKADRRNFALDYEKDIKSIELRIRGNVSIIGKTSVIVIKVAHGRKISFCFGRPHVAELKSALEVLAPKKLVINDARIQWY